jgi:parallel beta-helix repeat protein
MYLDTVGHWWIHGGEIDGNEANQTTPGGAANTNSYGFFLNDTNDIKITDMYIHECCRAGIKTQGTGGGTYAVDTFIAHCNISDCNWSGVLPDTNTKGMIVLGCLFVGDGEGGVAGGTVSPIWDITVDSCTCHDMVGGKAPVGYEAGIYIEAGSQIKVVNNHCFNCKVGIFVTADGDYQNIVANNTVHDCTGNAECPGILVKSPQTIISGNNVVVGVAFKPLILAGSGADHYGSECIIIGNSLFNATANVHGIQVVRSDNAIVANNVIRVPNKGIMVMTNSSYCNITGNRVIGAAMGIELDNAACTRNWVDSNNFDGCTDACTDTGTNTRFGSNIDHAGAIVIAGAP